MVPEGIKFALFCTSSLIRGHKICTFLHEWLATSANFMPWCAIFCHDAVFLVWPTFFPCKKTTFFAKKFNMPCSFTWNFSEMLLCNFFHANKKSFCNAIFNGEKVGRAKKWIFLKIYFSNIWLFSSKPAFNPEMFLLKSQKFAKIKSWNTIS